MLVLNGPEALSHFRIERLLREIQYITPHVDNLYAQYLYFVDSHEALSQAQIETLQKVLLYGTPFEHDEFNLDNTPYIIILPKNGHYIAEDLKSWSANALEIIHDCGLKQVTRIMRGIVYYIETTQKFTFGDKQAIANVIMDPKTQQVIFDKDEMTDAYISEMIGDDSKVWPLQKDEMIQQSSQHLDSILSHCPRKDGICISGFSIPTLIPLNVNEKCPLMRFVSEIPVMAANHNNQLGKPTLAGFFNIPFNENAHSQIEVIKKMDIETILHQLLRLPQIADKSYLITILDRTAGGLVAQDQMIGPWQIPVSNYAIVADDFDALTGKAFAVGEKLSLQEINPNSAKRMSYAESITNIAASKIINFSDIQFFTFDKKIDFPFFNHATYYEAEGEVSITDKARKSYPLFGGDGIAHIIASAPVADIQTRITPLLCLDKEETVLLFIDIANGQKRLGGSAFAQVINDTSKMPCPDIEEPAILENFFNTIQSLQAEDKILAYHDRSDGGLLITVLEMAFASQCGIRLDISELGLDPFTILFNEELGVVVQVRVEDIDIVLAVFDMHGIPSYLLGEPVQSDSISILFNNQLLFSQERLQIQRAWSELNYQIQFVRDNPRCAKKYFDRFSTKKDPGLWSELSFDLDFDNIALHVGVKPKIAILREQGVLGDCEMAKAFEKAGFDCVDVHMDNLESGHFHLNDFKGIALCGGFSFSDVLGAGLGWANRILFTESLREQFQHFFHRTDSFTLGIGNGGQMLTSLKSIIPGAELWPNFVKNYSEQFESRLVLVEVQASPSLFFHEMAGSVIPVPVAHGEGRVEFMHSEQEDVIIKEKMVALRYVDNWGRKTKNYPANPDGSPHGITGFTNTDGRITVLMPHPERAFRSAQYSWHPKEWGLDSPWLKMFLNSRKWVS